MIWVTPIIWEGIGEIEPKNVVSGKPLPTDGAMAWTCCRYSGCGCNENLP